MNQKTSTLYLCLQAYKPVDDFLNNLGGFLGTWQSYGGGKFRIDLGGNSDLFFYPKITSGEDPSIQIKIDGVVVIKVRLK